MQTFQEQKNNLFSCFATKGWFSSKSRNDTICKSCLHTILYNFTEFWEFDAENFYTKFFIPFLLAEKIKILSVKKKICILNFLLQVKSIFNDNKSSLKKILSNILEKRVYSGDFDKVKLLGQGSYGKIWQVLEKKTQKKYALKQSKNKPTDIDYQSKILEQINLLDPNTLRKVGITENYQLLMQYLENYETLDSYIKKYPDRLETVIKKVVKLVDKLHKNGITHRDLKGNNIMIHPITMDIKIIDFGHSCLKQSKNPDLLCKPIQTTAFYPVNTPKTFQEWIKADKYAIKSFKQATQKIIRLNKNFAQVLNSS